MKTLKLTLILAGLFSMNAVFSFSALNLPLDKLTSNPSEELIDFDKSDEVLDVVVSDKTNVKKQLLKDTILIDLSDEKIVHPFPSASKDCIMKQVPYPEFAREKQIEGGVAVQFRFDENGVVHIIDACSNSLELEQYVRTKLSSLQLKNCVVDINKDYYLRFMFRIL